MEKNEDVTDMLMADENVNYAWKSVTLTYYVDDKHFPDAKDASGNIYSVSLVSALVLLNLLNVVNEFNKFNNSGTRLLGSILKDFKNAPPA